MSTTTVAAGSEPDTPATNLQNNTPTKSRKSFGISRKASAMRLVSSTFEKSSSTLVSEKDTNTSSSNSNSNSINNMPLSSTPKEKKSSSGFLSYFFRPFRSQKSTPKKIPHTTALEQSEFTSPPRKDSKIDSELPLAKIPSLPSTPNPTRFSQALFNPPIESSIPAQIAASRRSSSDNPLLFIAFEQAIKSGVLTAPSIPPELIIKYHQENEARFQRERKSRFARKGSLSKTLDVGWTQKLFILAPGLLLQYGSDGSYDREPERILRLRPDSLTFATDVFEGKHFVLQITAGGESTTLTPDERRPSIMSRFGSKSRFDAYAMLLIFDGAEEMQDWLVKIRKEISRLGGPSIEEHPQPASKANTIVEEDDRLSRTPTNSRRSLDSSRKNSSGRKSDEIAPSMSTTASQDGLILDGLRANSNYSFTTRERGSQGSSETSPERSSIPDTRDRRRSTVSTAYSHSSTDLRLKSRPASTVFGLEYSTSERPPSPTLTQVSTSSFAGRRSRGALPAPIPIPVPSIPKRHGSTASYVGELPTPDVVNRRVRRSRKSSAPPSPDRMLPLLSTSLPNPTSPNSLSQRRPRPVSLASAPVTPRKDTSSRNLKRRSLGALSSAAHGPPLHPPPSAPLPRLPDGTTGTFPKLPVSMLSPHMHGIPPVPQIPIPIPHSPLALHSQSAADISPISRKQSLRSLSSRA
ncbi:hypothetical protein ABW19_dt0207413 [Dactylella cylindrospora]|nr:hypothetical protein ABW19_dt0207413 [Dactylella cylindrospora]